MIRPIFIAFLIISAIVAFIANQIRKARMRRALGRDVRDSEVTSLTSWMQVIEEEEKKPQ